MKPSCEESSSSTNVPPGGRSVSAATTVAPAWNMKNRPSANPQSAVMRRASAAPRDIEVKYSKLQQIPQYDTGSIELLTTLARRRMLAGEMTA